MTIDEVIFHYDHVSVHVSIVTVVSDKPDSQSQNNCPNELVPDNCEQKLYD
jgi:hypothetical protein